jgi:hypothetical protein
MPRQVDPRHAQRPPTQPPGDLKPVDPADVLARVYALILSWPTAEEKRAQQQQGSNGL